MTILDTIVATKREEIAVAKAAVPEAQLRQEASGRSPARDFRAALAAANGVALIAEVKRASPSAGTIREDFDPTEIALTYQQHGATCVSVLTDETYFQGSLGYLRTIRESIELPILRKDFLLDPYQVWEARAAGADAVLLIAECLDDPSLRELMRVTALAGMVPLVEIYAEENLSRVLDAGATLIGINNRNLANFEVDLERTIRLRKSVPRDRLLVGESGIRSRRDVQRLADAGVDAILVGEHFMRQRDIGGAVDALMGRGDAPSRSQRQEYE